MEQHTHHQGDIIDLTSVFTVLAKKRKRLEALIENQHARIQIMETHLCQLHHQIDKLELNRCC